MAKRQKPKETRKKGRPSTYTPAIGKRICDLLGEGKGLRDIVAEPGMPNLTTVFEWIRNHEDFSKQYREARQNQAELYAEEIRKISDGIDGKNEARDKLRMDARKWIASRLLPKVYGDRVGIEASGPGGGPITVVVSKELDGLE